MPDNLTYKKLNDLRGNNSVFYNTFIQAGYTPVQASGMIGNLMFESGGYDDIKTNAGEKSGNGFGAAQWTDPKRKKGLQSFANNLGLSVKDARAQALYIVHELENDYKNTATKLRQSSDVKNAMEIFLQEYENPRKEHQVEGSNSYNKRLNFSNRVLGNKTPSWKWGVKSNNVNLDGVDNNLLTYLDTLEPEYQQSILATAGSDGKHSSTSRHYSKKAIDLRFDQKLYDRISKDPNRLKYGITLLDPDHGTAPHLHLSVGQGTENKKDVWLDPYSKDSLELIKNINTNNTQNSNQGFDQSQQPLFQQTETPQFDYLGDETNILESSIEKNNQQEAENARNVEIRNKLTKRQQERDFLVASVLSVNLPYVERNY